MPTSVLISGAGLAGPALAYWLAHHGFEPAVVEAAPALRTGGSAVDYRGPVHLGLLTRMGILDQLREVQTHGTAMRFVDEHGRPTMQMPAGFAGGELEVRRGDLSRILAAASGDRTEWIFGDRVAALSELPDRVEVTFAGGSQRSFDLVIGADGVHSGVRRLAFGAESAYVRHLGYYLGGWAVPGCTGEGAGLNVPGKLASVGDGQAFIAFSSPAELSYDRRDPEAQKQIIRAQFAGLGWEVPRILAALDTAGDLYFDQICRVDITPWSTGRIALIGDAACGATLGGMGNGTALIAAYVLAGELATAGGDHRAAFARYERRLAGFARRAQKGGDTAGRFLAPRTASGLRLRNWLHNQNLIIRLTMRIATERATRIELPDYDLSAASAPRR
ncbi:FAD-dependent monooxygenase [Actinoplanes sp. TFC3]|uniref:FAD-dependent monooxygenase n=1 Tax=Actinoplanes sp. TFC3 TaxID=1710355 RepID=UPI0008359E36|nr:FAD-dependent monooxygenase [Actinoplanes sp. TFC3]